MFPLPLLAQLVAPPLQQGPVRLPGPGATEQRPDADRPAPRIDIDEQPVKPSGPSEPGDTSPTKPTTSPEGLPEIRGSKRYSSAELTAILQPCLAISDPGERLKACAASLTAKLVADGYVNSRVFVETSPAPGRLEVVEGRIVEVRVNAKNPWLNRRVTRLLRALQGEVLNLAEVERQLRLLQRQAGIKSIRSNLSRLGSDPTQAVLTVNVELGSQPLQGDLSLRNDGSSGSGEGRAVGTLVKGGLATPGDILLLYGELNFDDNPSLGALITSASYTYPLSDQFNLTGSFGYSRRNLIELPAPANEFSTRQFQGLGQLEWVFRETLTQRWAAFAGLSINRSDTYFAGNALPSFLPESVRSPRTGFLRVGLSGSGLSNSVGWSGNVYALQGLGAFTPTNQINELAQVGIVPGQATALGGLVSAAWGFAPNWQLNLRAGGQLALNPLTSSMQFTLGSDVGLRGLPGQLISGDNGWLGTSELVWTFWQKNKNALQLVPFFGYGGINTKLQGLSFTDYVGSTGVLARWLAGNNWTLEAGWVNQLGTNTNLGPWADWTLSQGFYGKVQYRF
ncbi:ShlB/FhaC/HecB family hemolysin secretion/activation protein [Synechococcus sp. CS-1329]|uniref:ShlB/FhaC/HecB family hemolysin secretion/activation protein n=1 Tax=Synechococcus sp. CS-1329 TaxID=2847975 RepID=UPI00223AF75B|nr:ShlB/FhaC/HecB family hemolysin secretion/activation protein [Synechococcus sp. CS-1329]MCT0217658.1 ShlB/FhaC/HecB family hemolysin secretion/activation protein [Synechococcus sp. CS-1329]